MAHKKRYKKLSRQLCEQAVVECFKGKWRRNDVLTFIEKYAGIPRDDIKIDDLSGSWKYKNEAVEAIGLAMLGIVEDLIFPVIPSGRCRIVTGSISSGSIP